MDLMEDRSGRSAGTRLSVSEAALDAFRLHSSRLVAITVKRALSQKEDVSQHGADAERLISSGLEFTVRMLDSAMAAGEISFLEDELQWSLDRLPHDGVSTEQVLSRFRMLREVIGELLPRNPASEVSAVIEWMERRLGEIADERKG